MAKLRPCPWCGAKHKKSTAARKCHDKHKGLKKWTAAEIGRK